MILRSCGIFSFLRKIMCNNLRNLFSSEYENQPPIDNIDTNKGYEQNTVDDIE